MAARAVAAEVVNVVKLEERRAIPEMSNNPVDVRASTLEASLSMALPVRPPRSNPTWTNTVTKIDDLNA